MYVKKSSFFFFIFRNVNEGDELTAFYSNSYFGDDCRCDSCLNANCVLMDVDVVEPSFADLELKSPAFVESIFYKWPLESASSIEMLDVLRIVCEDLSVVKASLEHIVLDEVDTTCYKSMRDVCDTYNKAIDSLASEVSE